MDCMHPLGRTFIDTEYLGGSLASPEAIAVDTGSFRFSYMGYKVVRSTSSKAMRELESYLVSSGLLYLLYL